MSNIVKNIKTSRYFHFIATSYHLLVYTDFMIKKVMKSEAFFHSNISLNWCTKSLLRQTTD